MRFILFSILLGITLFAQSTMRYAISDKHAYMPPKHYTNFLVEYLKLNDKLDILNIKSQELGSTASYGSIGDMDGFSLKSIYAISEKSLISLKYSSQSIKYGSGTLNNIRKEGFVRYQIVQSDYSFFNALSLDFGLIENSADTMGYSDPKFLEPLATKVLRVKDTKIIQNSDGTYTIGVLKNDGSSDFLSNLKQKPTLYIDELKDDSCFLRALIEKKISEKLYISFFLQYKKTEVKSLISANSELLEKAKDKNYDISKNLNRSESSISGGFNISLSWRDLAWELSYKYSRIFRDSGLDYIDYNHIIDATLARPIGKHWLLYSGVKLMYRQFNGEIPYLYNRYTQTTFDHKYGYIRFGLEYRF